MSHADLTIGRNPTASGHVSLFFSRLPREIRDLIYHHVLVSSTGFITLYKGGYRIPTDVPRQLLRVFEIYPIKPAYPRRLPSVCMKLCLLWVCKQTYEECRGLFKRFWKHNALFIQNPEDMEIYPDPVRSQFRQQLTHVELLLDTHSQKQFCDSCQAIKTFLDRSKNGSLRKIVLVIDMSFSLERNLNTNYPHLQEMDRSMTAWPTKTPSAAVQLRAFQAACLSSSNKSLEKRILVKPLRRVLPLEWSEKSRSLQPGGFLAGLHSAFKGELLVNKVLILKDGHRPKVIEAKRRG